jgi:hypothetical protein
MKQKSTYALALEALMELSQELRGSEPKLADEPARLDKILNELRELPPEALLLGMADDRLPVLLNLHDPLPGPLLIIGEDGIAQTDFLKFIARVIEQTHDPAAVQFGVLSPTPEDWSEFESSGSCAGIAPINDDKASDFILSLNAWAHSNKTRQVVLLLLDGLELVKDWDQNSSDTLRWIFMRGPSRRVWPIVTLTEGEGAQVPYLLEHFRTRIYSQIPPEVGRYTVPLEADMNQNGEAGNLFMKEGSHWLHFWFPKT